MPDRKMQGRDVEDEDRSNRAQEKSVAQPAALREGEDYYYEGSYMVFTERYHLKRGTCCHSGCRHCPYKDKS